LRLIAGLAAAALILSLGGCAAPLPDSAELVGEWVYDDGASDGFSGAGVLTLEADGTFAADGIPAEVFDDTSGTWEVAHRTDTGAPAVELLSETSRAYLDITGDTLLSRPRGEETTVRYVLARTD